MKLVGITEQLEGRLRVPGDRFDRDRRSVDWLVRRQFGTGFVACGSAGRCGVGFVVLGRVANVDVLAYNKHAHAI